MLCLQMAAEGSRCKTHATDVTLHPMMFCSGVDRSVLLRVVHLFCVGYPYAPRDARHDFHLVGVRSEADAFKEFYENVEGALQSDEVSQSNQPVVNKKRHNLPACLREYPVSGFFVHRPLKPLPYYRINTNIKHKGGEWATLSNTTVGAKWFPKTTPSSTDHLHLLPEFCLEAQEFGSYPIPGHDG
jgi:hypothetical protein